MSTEVRADDGIGKFLFSWNPMNQTIDIVVKNMFYRVQLYTEPVNGAYYCVLEKKMKQKIA